MAGMTSPMSVTGSAKSKIEFSKKLFMEKFRVKIEDYVEEWLEIGFKWIGGCCRVEPHELSEIRNKM